MSLSQEITSSLSAPPTSSSSSDPPKFDHGFIQTSRKNNLDYKAIRAALADAERRLLAKQLASAPREEQLALAQLILKWRTGAEQLRLWEEEERKRQWRFMIELGGPKLKEE
ncbi:hypothetical protein HDV00_000053 [Rhizophlyctis rosea]|nr:hypothetical protein HDV00_000053 [Rhizophlyctis rosea]